jgi:hypothetical protein
MDKHDILKNGVISYNEFKAVLLDLGDIESAQNYKLKTNLESPDYTSNPTE